MVKAAPKVSSGYSYQLLQLLPAIAGGIGLISFGTLLWKVMQTHNATSFPISWIVLNLTAQILVLIYGIVVHAWGIWAPGILFTIGLLYMLYIKLFSQELPPQDQPEGGQAKPPFLASSHPFAQPNMQQQSTQPQSTQPQSMQPQSMQPQSTQPQSMQRQQLEQQLQQFRYAEQLEEPWGQKGLPKAVADQPIPSNSDIQ